MNEDAPLKGKKVLVPRSREQAKSFSKLVKGYGGIPVEIPLLDFVPVKVSDEIRSILDRLDSFDWIIFTSNVTVDTFLSFITDRQKAEMPKIAVIGKKTRDCLHHLGLSVDFTPKEYVAEGFVEEFLPFVKKGMNILIPKGNLARSYISSSLREKGANVEEVIIYQTVFPDESKVLIKEALMEDRLDVLTFTSPSTMDHFMETVKEYNLYPKLSNCIIGCIGPVTRQRIESFGLKVHCEPEEYTTDEMLKSISDFINKNC